VQRVYGTEEPTQFGVGFLPVAWGGLFRCHPK